MFVQYPPRFLPTRSPSARRWALGFLLAAPLAIGLLALALGQDANWDLRNYHYYNAYAFLHRRYDRDLLPSQTPYFYNPLLDVPFFVLAQHLPARAAGFLLGLAQGFNVILLFMIAHATLMIPHPRHKVFICAGIAVLGFLGGGGIALIGTTFGDNITSLGALLPAALIVRHCETLAVRDAKTALTFAFFFGLPAGFMVGLKLPAAIYAVGLCVGLFFIGGACQRRFSLAVMFGCGVMAGIAVTLGSWAVFLQSHFGNPLFPYFNQIFHSPLAPPISARDTEYAPHGWHDILLMPFLFAGDPLRVGEIPWRDWRLPVLYVMLPLSMTLRLVFGRNRAAPDRLAAPYAARYLLTSFAVSYLVWLLLFTIYRYAITLEMIAPLLIVFCVGILPLKLSTRGLVAACILALVSLSIQPGNWGRRDHWLDHFVEADIPALAATSHLMILMAGIEPYSHLLPEFPPDIAFVRIQSNFSSPEQNKGINSLMQQRIDAHRHAGGTFMMLIPDWQHDVAEQALSAFGLKMLADCQSVTDRLYHDKKLDLCPVIPIK